MVYFSSNEVGSLLVIFLLRSEIEVFFSYHVVNLVGKGESWIYLRCISKDSCHVFEFHLVSVFDCRLDGSMKKVITKLTIDPTCKIKIVESYEEVYIVHIIIFIFDTSYSLSELINNTSDF